MMPRSYTNIVHEGKREARLLNCPTANIRIYPPFPNDGVYSCIVKVGETVHHGMCYYDGKRPGILESHLFDYSENLYGQELTVMLKTFIRPPQIFGSLEELKQQILQDAFLSRQDLEPVVDKLLCLEDCPQRTTALGSRR